MVSLGAGLCGPDVDDQPKVQMAPNALLLLHTPNALPSAQQQKVPLLCPAVLHSGIKATQSKSHTGLQWKRRCWKLNHVSEIKRRRQVGAGNAMVGYDTDPGGKL